MTEASKQLDAKVHFTDGFSMSCCVRTTNKDLEKRIAAVLFSESGRSANQTATKFIINSVIKDIPAVAFNTPEGKTLGGTIAVLSGRGYWPNNGNASGVFLAWVDGSGKVEYWGGSGFDDGVEVNPNLPTEAWLKAESLDV